MITVTPYQQKKARLRFIALYLISLALIVIVLSAFWKTATTITQAAPASAALEESDFVKLDTLLHARLIMLDTVYAAYLKNNRDDTTSINLLSVKNGFIATLDSFDKEASILEDGPKKKSIQGVVETFRKSFAARDKLIGDIALLPKDIGLAKWKASATAVPAAQAMAANKETEALKARLLEKEKQLADIQNNQLPQQEEKTQTAMLTAAQTRKELQEKDRVIVSLQNQLKQKLPPVVNPLPSSATSNGTDAEWKQKHATLKAAFDKLAGNEKALRSAYKTVTDDNRRLLSQLQAARKS